MLRLVDALRRGAALQHQQPLRAPERDLPRRHRGVPHRGRVLRRPLVSGRARNPRVLPRGRRQLHRLAPMLRRHGLRGRALRVPPLERDLHRVARLLRGPRVRTRRLPRGPMQPRRGRRVHRRGRGSRVLPRGAELRRRALLREHRGGLRAQRRLLRGPTLRERAVLPIDKRTVRGQRRLLRGAQLSVGALSHRAVHPRRGVELYARGRRAGVLREPEGVLRRGRGQPMLRDPRGALHGPDRVLRQRAVRGRAVLRADRAGVRQRAPLLQREHLSERHLRRGHEHLRARRSGGLRFGGHGAQLLRRRAGLRRRGGHPAVLSKHRRRVHDEPRVLRLAPLRLGALPGARELRARRSRGLHGGVERAQLLRRRARVPRRGGDQPLLPRPRRRVYDEPRVLRRAPLPRRELPIGDALRPPRSRAVYARSERPRVLRRGAELRRRGGRHPLLPRRGRSLCRLVRVLRVVDLSLGYLSVIGSRGVLWGCVWSRRRSVIA